MYIIIPVRSNQPPQSVLNPCIAKLPTPTAVQEIAYIIKNQLLFESEGSPSTESYLAIHKMYRPTKIKAKLEIVFAGSRIQLSWTFSQKPEALVPVQLQSFKA